MVSKSSAKGARPHFPQGRHTPCAHASSALSHRSSGSCKYWLVHRTFGLRNDLTFFTGNAKIEGLEDSLQMRGTDYNIAVGIFFVPYVLCEVPSNVLLSKFKKPSWYMGFLVISWGIVSLLCYANNILSNTFQVMTFTGVTQSFGGLIATRFLLGV